MAAAGACMWLVIWVQLYFFFVYLLHLAPERYSRPNCCHRRPANTNGTGEPICVYATAQQTGQPAAQKEQGQAPVSAKDTGVFTLFQKLKYRFFGWTPADRIVAGINMDTVYLIAGDPRADLPRMIQTNLDDVMILFFRWLTEDDLVWPLQREVTKAALFREHHRYGRQFLHEVSVAEQTRLASASTPALSVQAHQQVSAAKARLHKWFFDGNTFVKRDREGRRSDYLTEDDVDFMRGLPLNVVRIARGVFAPEMPVTVARLAEELQVRNITKINQLLEKTNFIDFFALFDLFDEAFTQVDVLREFHRNWVNEGISRMRQQVLPGVQWNGARNLTALVTSPTTSPAEFPKCSTLKCFMRLKWNATPTRIITVEKTNVNSLKLLLVGNSGEGDPFKAQGSGWRDKIKSFFGFDELQQTVAALKDWHAREKADAVLGLGSIFGIPSVASVRSEQFDTKWYNLFVKDAGLDVPWLMTVGEHEGVLSPATPIRYHYTLQQPNWHMPNDMYTVVFQFQADLKLENGAVQRDAFNVTVVNLNTWALLAGNPITNNLQMQLSRMTWISRQLFAATKRNSTWVIVMGHHPIISTGVEGKQARLQYMEDVYSNGHFRGWEHFMMHHLLFHYQVDAYISGHDYLMEYNTMEDLDKNTTISFINSGATARIMDRTIGRGWIGRLRGALYPILCFAGRRIFFPLNPGGCAPSESEKSYAFGWFAPKYGNFKLNIVERSVRATGFSSLQLTKDFMIVEFVDGRTKKPATRRLQRRSNKVARDVTFADPVALGRKKYAEVRQQREEFARANLDLLRKEIYLAKHCPILAERLSVYTREINHMAERYEKIRQENEAFQQMTETEIQEAAAAGLDWDVEVDRANAEMRAVAKYHRHLKEKYAILVAFKDTLPSEDDPRYEEVLQHEKTMMTLRRKSLDLARQQGYRAPLELADRYAIIDKKINALAAIISDLEEGIKASPSPVSKPETTQQAPGLVTETSKEVLIASLINVEDQLRRLDESLLELPQTDARPSFDRVNNLHRQLQTKLEDIRAQLVAYLEPLHPAFVWQKQQELHTSAAKVKYMTDYLARTLKPSQSSPDTVVSDSTASHRVQAELEKLRDHVNKLEKMLEFRYVTPLQRQYLEKKTALALTELVQTQQDYLSGEEKDVQRVKRSLRLAAEAEKRLRAEVDQLEQQVKKELQHAVAEWEKQQDSREKESQVQGTKEQVPQGSSDTNNSRDGMTEANTAESVGSPPATTKTDKRRLSAMHSATVTEGVVSQLGEQYSTVFRKALSKLGSKNRSQGSFHGRSVTHNSGARRLSAHKPVEASGEEARVPQESDTPGRSIHFSNKDAAVTQGRLRTGSEDYGQRGQSAEVEKCVGPCKPSSTTAFEQVPGSDGTQVLEKAKDDQSRDAGEKAANASDVTPLMLEAQNSGQKKEADADKGKTPGSKRAPEEKTDINDKSKRLAGDKLQSVPEYSEPENEELQDQLEKIDVGPLDGCQLIPLLDVVVRRALHPEENAESDAKCENTFADRAVSGQLKILTVNQILSKGPQGLGGGVHPVPSVHVSRGWRLYFQDSPKIMFKTLMRDLKAGLRFVEETFKRSEEETALRQRMHEKRVPATKHTRTPQDAAVHPPVGATE